jgi:hypothetical protein
MQLGIPQKIGAISDVIRSRKILAFITHAMPLASLNALAIARRLRRLVPVVALARCGQLAYSFRAARRGVLKLAGVVWIAGRRVARH